MVGRDLVPRVVEGGAELGGRVVQRPTQLVGGDAKFVDLAAVEALGQLAERVITPLPHVADDLADGIESGAVV